jgi:Flp pilus assembly protein TadG
MMKLSDLPRSLRRFHDDVSGAIMLWVTIMIVVVIGLIGLAVDGARILNLNSNLKEISDASALAGAKELDGAADAITRATNAAVNYLNNNPAWSDIAQSGVQIVSTGADAPTFYSSINPDVVTTNPKLASYIKVTTITRGITPSFIVAIAGNANTYTNASSMASSSYSVCKPMQSFMCNPFEGTETNPGNANNWIANVPVGSMLKLVAGSGAAPGNWGLIAPPGVNGNPHNQAGFWSGTTPNSCAAVSVGDSGQPVDTGNNGQFAEPGMDVRFDNPQTNLPNGTLSAPIVIDGFSATGSGNNCSNSASATPTVSGLSFTQTDQDAANYDNYCNQSPIIGSCPLPRDRTFANLGGTGGWQPSLIGPGANSADLDAYWANHHTGTRPAALNTRYKIYQAEIDPAGSGYAGAAFTGASDALEDHAPACSNSTVGPPERRLVTVAIVDCNYWSINGASNNLPITTLVAQFFMTEPATSSITVPSVTPSQYGGIYGELVGTYSVNDPNGAVYQIVQLVR